MLISVIIPCYNDGKYLDDSVGSILKQTYKDVEIIIVNDGSTDEFTLEKLNSFSELGIRIIHKENGRMASARNCGFEQARGEIIVTLDADDMFGPSFIEKGLKIITSSKDIGAVTCYLKSFGLKKYKWKPLGGGVSNFLYRAEACGSAMVRKEAWKAIGGYDENMKKGYEDWEFWLRLSSNNWKVGVIKEFLLFYRVTEKSMLLTQSEPARKELIQYILQKHNLLYNQQLANAIIQRKIIDTRSSESIWVLIKHLYWKLLQKEMYKPDSINE